MKRQKLILSGLSMILVLATTACGAKEAKPNPQSQQQTSEHITSSSLQDDKFIPKNLTELNSKELLKAITGFGYRMSGTEENAKVGKLIKSYFEKVGLQSYKDDSYYHSFDANSGISYINPDNGKDYEITLKGKLENIVAKIKGEDSSKAIVVSAHFDTFFDTKGVLDNASGTTALLEVAKNITSQLQGKTPPVDIVFVALNAEEQYLLGSKAFYNELSKDYKEFYNINMDCVGLKDKPLAYKNSNSKSEQLYKDFETYIDKYKIAKGSTDYMEQGTSDHAVFQDNGKAAIVLGEEMISKIIHSERDNDLELIDYQELERLVRAVSDFIIDSKGKMY